MSFVAVSGNAVVFRTSTREHAEQLIDTMCNRWPDLFYKKYITVMSEEEFENETF